MQFIAAGGGRDGRLTGYGGGLDRKRWLLRHEGVELA
jgi:methylated-DNA-[protein]-cysteine S-methyltransferase